MAHDDHGKPRRPGAVRAGAAALSGIALAAAFSAGNGFLKERGIMAVTAHSATAHARPPIDEAPPKTISTATFAMG